MKRVSKWALAIGVAGFFISLYGFIRYFIIWDDPSQGLLFIGLGLLACAWAFNYNTGLGLRNEQDAMGEALHEHINNE